MADFSMVLFEKLALTTNPSVEEREAIYQACRAELKAKYSDEATQTKAIDSLEKAIRRQEMQVLYEESLTR
jgi:hypothetical protein